MAASPFVWAGTTAAALEILQVTGTATHGFKTETGILLPHPLPDDFLPNAGNYILLTERFNEYLKEQRPGVHQILQAGTSAYHAADEDRRYNIRLICLSLAIALSYHIVLDDEENRRLRAGYNTRLATQEDFRWDEEQEGSQGVLTPTTSEDEDEEREDSDRTIRAPSDRTIRLSRQVCANSPIRLIMTPELVQGILPSLPEGWKSDNPNNPSMKILGTISPPVMRKIEPYGPHFLAYARRKRHGRTFSEDERIEAQSKVKNIENEDLGEISEPEDPMMLARDAKDWKGQDHYAVLGLSKYRYKATDAQIKAATRKKVLRHHPDKQAAARAKTGDDTVDSDSFFKCIQRANEILSDPVKRRQFDSVDEAADVNPPSKKDITKPSHFYKKWGAFFEAEGRFSKNAPVPKLGDDRSTEEEVVGFYDFWYNFDSWRTFEYLDEDVPDDNEGRDHKRHIEKKNSNARRKHKSEDIARLRKQVDACSATDERIKKFRKDNAANKNKKRLEREAVAKREAEEKQKAKEAEEAQKKAEEEAAKAEREQGKKAKEAAKNAVKKNKRTLKGSVKDVNYFNLVGEASPKQISEVLDDVDLVIEKISPDELADLAGKLSLAGKDGGKVKEVFVAEVERLVGVGKVTADAAKVFK